MPQYDKHNKYNIAVGSQLLITQLHSQIVNNNKIKHTHIQHRHLGMSTLIKSIAELPWLSQVVVCMLVGFVCGAVVLAKFVFKWWSQTNNNSNTNPTTPPKTQPNQPPPSLPQSQSHQSHQSQSLTKSQLLVYILKSQTIAEPLHHNQSLNKTMPLLVLQIWIYLLLCTQWFMPVGEIYWLGVVARLAMALGWVGLLLGGGDLGVRYFWVLGILANRGTKGTKGRKGKQGLEVGEELSQPEAKINNQLPKTIYIYYITILLTTLTLTILTILTILNSNTPTNTPTNTSTITNYYYSSSQHTLILFFIMMGILITMHHLLVVVVGAVVWAFVRVVGVGIGRGQVWGVVFGGVDGWVERENVGNFQQSRQNIVTHTYRNNIQNLIFTQPQQPNPTNITNITNIHQTNINSSCIKPTPKKTRLQDSSSTSTNNKLIKSKVHLELSENQVRRKKKKEIFVMPSQFVADGHLQAQDGGKAKGKDGEKGKDEEKRKDGENEDVNEDCRVYFKRRKCFSMDISTKHPLDSTFSATDIQLSQQKQKKPPKFFTQQPIKIKPRQPQSSQQPLQIVTKKQPEQPHKHPNSPIQLQSQPQPQKQPQSSSTQEQSEDILCNIQNKMQGQSIGKKKKKGNLKVVNYDENQHEIDVIDLSQYAVKDLGQAKPTSNSFQPPILNFRKKNYLPSLHLAAPQKPPNPIPQNDQYLARKKNSIRAPNVPDVKAEGVTFCLDDLSRK